MKKLLFTFLIIITVGSCAYTYTSPSNREDIKLIIKSDNPGSLEFWTADTVFFTNPFLVRLMDTLFRYVRSDEFPSEDILQDVKWMNQYRAQLADYYRRNYKFTVRKYIYSNMECDSAVTLYEISEYDMADSVIMEARRLWAIDPDWSTMGMIVGNDTERSRLIFEQFNEFSRLYDKCEEQEQREILAHEFKTWLELEDLLLYIYANFTDMLFYGGSIRGPIISAGILDIWRAHIDLYRKEYAFLYNDGPCEDSGTLVKPARRLLLDCCAEALSEYENPYFKEEYEEYGDYMEIVNDTKELLQRLPSTVDKWIEARKPWEKYVCFGWVGWANPRNTAEVLIKYAHLVSSIQ